jgi:hypothetical protein
VFIALESSIPVSSRGILLFRVPQSSLSLFISLLFSNVHGLQHLIVPAGPTEETRGERTRSVSSEPAVKKFRCRPSINSHGCLRSNPAACQGICDLVYHSARGQSNSRLYFDFNLAFRGPVLSFVGLYNSLSGVQGWPFSSLLFLYNLYRETVTDHGLETYTTGASDRPSSSRLQCCPKSRPISCTRQLVVPPLPFMAKRARCGTCFSLAPQDRLALVLLTSKSPRLLRPLAPPHRARSSQ